MGTRVFKDKEVQVQVYILALQEVGIEREFGSPVPFLVRYLINSKILRTTGHLKSPN